MANVARAIGYTGGLQRLVWDGTTNVEVRCYLWGAGGGGGGRDGGAASANESGGNGTGGGYCQRILTLAPGESLEVAVAQGGGAGVSGAGSAAGGLGGQSLSLLLFDSRNAAGSYPVTNGAWSPFMNAHAVWGGSSNTYNYSQTVNFPFTGLYTFTHAVDEAMTVTVDGTTVVSYSGFRANPAVTTSVFVTAGPQTVAWTAQNFTSARGIALTITQSFSGGNGSAAGPNPFSGGGGGGGGATVLLRNNEIIAIAAGGGGGGGGGKTLGAVPPTAPGDFVGQANDGISAGQNGQSKGGDGGGAGGGGGGYGGGNGGYVQGGDVNGVGGMFGKNLGDNRQNPVLQLPGGRNNSYYAKNSRGGLGAVGGVNTATGGDNGYAVFEFISSSVAVYANNRWQQAQNVYVYQSGSWQAVKNINIRDGGVWREIRGIDPPVATSIPSDWGRLPRPNV